jgi:hypothetical protein
VPDIGFNESLGKVFNGTSWSVSWKSGGDPLHSAVAVFADGTEAVVPSVLNSDLAGKGYIKLQVPRQAVQKPKAKARADNAFWSGEHQHFGSIKIIKKFDIKGDQFASLVNGKGQLSQSSALSVKKNFALGCQLMQAVAERAIRDNINTKQELNPLRDQIRAASPFKELIEALPAVAATKEKSSSVEGALPAVDAAKEKESSVEGEAEQPKTKKAKAGRKPAQPEKESSVEGEAEQPKTKQAKADTKPAKVGDETPVAANAQSETSSTVAAQPQAKGATVDTQSARPKKRCKVAEKGETQDVAKPEDETPASPDVADTLQQDDSPPPFGEDDAPSTEGDGSTFFI